MNTFIVYTAKHCSNMLQLYVVIIRAWYCCNNRCKKLNCLRITHFFFNLAVPLSVSQMVLIAAIITWSELDNSYVQCAAKHSMSCLVGDSVSQAAASVVTSPICINHLIYCWRIGWTENHIVQSWTRIYV